MSSVTRFIRQIDNSNMYLKAADVLAASSTAVFELVPSAGNVVANYPPGFMQTASGPLVTALAAQGAGAVLRDMGKTIRAPLGSLTGAVGYFRQVQLLIPAGESNNFLGGASGNLGGVRGAPATPDAYTNYMTFYVSIAVCGVNAAPLVSLLSEVQGQM